jgi:hypothetical protein
MIPNNMAAVVSMRGRWFGGVWFSAIAVLKLKSR